MIVSLSRLIGIRVGGLLSISSKSSRGYRMQINTLMDLNKKMHYLEEEATLPELLKFLGMRYSEVSRTKGNEYHDVYEFVDDFTMAIEVLLKESKVRFHSKLNAYTVSKDDSFWDILFETRLDVLSRLLDGLEEKYSDLGTLTFEFFTCGQFEAFDIDYGPCGWQICWK